MHGYISYLPRYDRMKEVVFKSKTKTLKSNIQYNFNCKIKFKIILRFKIKFKIIRLLYWFSIYNIGMI